MSEFEFIKRIVFREYPGKIALLVLNELFASFIMLIGIGGIITMLGTLLGGEKQLPGILGDIFNTLGLYSASSMQIILFLAILFIIRMVLESFTQYMAANIGIQLNQSIKNELNQALAKASWTEFSTSDQGKYMQVLVNESSLARGAVNDLGGMLAAGIIAVVPLLWMTYYSPTTLAFFFVVSLLFFPAIQKLMKYTQQTGEERIEALKEMNNIVTDNRYLFKTLYIENLLRFRLAIVEKLITVGADIERRQLIYAISNKQIVNFLTIILLLLISYINLVDQARSGTNLIFDLLILERLGTSISNFQQKRQAMMQKIPSYQASLDMIDLFKDSPEIKSEKLQIISLGSGIRLENISFSYPESKRGVQNISLNLPSKGLYFIVGRSGSGKTTLVDLIAGIQKPDSGLLFIDGKKLLSTEAPTLSRIIAYLHQQAYLFTGTLRENLSLGLRNISDEAIIDALKASDSLEIYNKLDEGLDTLILSGGINFSGGERQRLSMTRALVKNARILVLDEPTSSLDSGSEKKVMHSLEKISQGALVLVITHSQEVIQDKKNIYLLDKGNLVWHGDYSELSKREDLINLIRDPNKQ